MSPACGSGLQRQCEPVDANAGVAVEDGRGERVEVVLARQQEHRRDLLEPGAAAGGRREQLTGRQLEPCLPDLLTLLLQASPHQDRKSCGVQRSPEVDYPQIVADQKWPGARRTHDAQTPGQQVRQ